MDRSKAGRMIVTTVPTGTIGSRLLDRLLASTDETVRVVVRDPGKLRPDVRERVDLVAGSHGDPAVIGPALAGADALFWVTPPPWSAASLRDGMEEFARPAVDAVERLRIAHVVSISNLGRGVPGDAGVVAHNLAVDDMFAATGAACRALTLPGLMDNLRRDAASIVDVGRFSGPLRADVKVPWVATTDVAAVGAGLLLDRSWTGQESRPVLGPDDLSMNQAALVLSELLGRPVEYVEVGMDAFRLALLARGASPAMADGMVAMMVAKNAGLDNHETRTPGNSSPTSLRDWVQENFSPVR
jgi:uncharacterized protein YbjT (DUF2867 family)